MWHSCHPSTCKLLSPAALSLRPATNVSPCRPLCLQQRLLHSIVVVVIVVITVITVATTIFPPLSRDLFDCCVLFHCHFVSPSSSGGGHPTHRIIRCHRHCHCPHCQHRRRCCHRRCHCQLIVVSSVAPLPAAALSAICICQPCHCTIINAFVAGCLPILPAAYASASCHVTSCWLLSPGASSYCLL